MNVIDGRARQMLENRRTAIFRLLSTTEVNQHQPELSDSEGRVLRCLSESEEREFREIDEALARIANGSYGRCESCNGSIGRQRLAAIPEARLCIACSAATG